MPEKMHSLLTVSRWAVIWQDSLLSLGFDRPAATAIDFKDAVFAPEVATEGLSYREAMYVVCKQALRITVRNRETSVNVDEILQDVAELDTLFSRVQPRIRSVADAKLLHDRIQFYSLRINCSFTLATLLRPSLSREKWRFMPPEQKESFASRCRFHLTECLRAYVRLQSFTTAATRSWALLHNSLSSALLLAIIGETNRNTKVRDLQGQLIDFLTKATAEEPDIADNVESPKIWGPHARALVALKALHSRATKTLKAGPILPNVELQSQEISRPTLPKGVATEVQNSADTQFTEGRPVSLAQEDTGDTNSSNQPQLQWQDINLLEFSPENLFESVLWGDYVGHPEQGFTL